MQFKFLCNFSPFLNFFRKIFIFIFFAPAVAIAHPSRPTTTIVFCIIYTHAWPMVQIMIFFSRVLLKNPQPCICADFQLCKYDRFYGCQHGADTFYQGWGSGYDTFSTGPDPDPTYNNVCIKLFSSWTKYKPESTNSSIKWWVIISNFMPTYLKYKYIFSSFRFKVGSGFFPRWAGSREKNVWSWSLV